MTKTASQIYLGEPPLGEIAPDPFEIVTFLESLQDSVATGLLPAATWVELQTLTFGEGILGGTVNDSDSGTHLQATATGYDGASVPNAGTYRYVAEWDRLKWIGDTGLAGKSNVGHGHAVEDVAGLQGELDAKADGAATTAALNKRYRDAFSGVTNFVNDGANFSVSLTGAPEAVADLAAGAEVSFADDATVGKVLRITHDGSGNTYVCTKRALPFVAGHTYEATAILRVNVADGGTVPILLQTFRLDADFLSPASLGTTSTTLAVTGDFVTVSVVATASGTFDDFKWLRARLGFMETAAGDKINILSFGIEDVTALDAKAPLDSPTFTGVVSGVTKTHVGLGSVDNTADADKPVSGPQQTALDTKADKTQTLSGSGLAATSGTLGADPTVTVTAAVEADVRLGTESAKAVTPAALDAPLMERAEHAKVAAVLNMDPDLVAYVYGAGMADAAGRLGAWVGATGFTFRQATIEGDSHGDYAGGITPLLRGAGGATFMGYDGAALAAYFARMVFGGAILPAPDASGDYAVVKPILYAGDGKTLLLGADADGLRLTLSDQAIYALEAKRALDLSAVPVGLLADPEEVNIHSATLFTARGPDETGVNRRYFLRRDVTPGCAMAETRGPVEVVTIYGQSYTTGGGASDLAALMQSTILTSDILTPHHDLMPITTEAGTGIISTGAQLVDGAAITDLVPLVSTEWEDIPSDYGGETGFPACARFLRRSEQAAGLSNVTRAWFAHGQGGASITDLDDTGSNCYRNGLITLQRIKDIAAIYGRNIIVRDWHWSQGQADGGKTRQEYIDLFIALRTQYLSDIAAITGQDLGDDPVTVWMDQVAPSEDNDGRQVSLSQLDLMTENPGEIYLTAPWYFLPYVDEIHPTPLAYAVHREYNAKVKRIVDSGGTWTGVRPAGPLVVDGSTVTVPFYNQGSDLVVDTTTLPQAPGWGFELVGESETIDAIAILPGDTSDQNKIELTLSGAPTVTPYLRYAYTGPVSKPGGRAGAWGNIRNQDTTPSLSDPGRNLVDWAFISDANPA